MEEPYFSFQHCILHINHIKHAYVFIYIYIYSMYIYLVIVIKKCDCRIIYHFTSQILSNMILMVSLINNRVYEGQRHSVAYIYSYEPRTSIKACLNESYLCNYSALAYLWWYWRMAAQNIDERGWHLAIIVLSFSQ